MQKDIKLSPGVLALWLERLAIQAKEAEAESVQYQLETLARWIKKGALEGNIGDKSPHGPE